MVSLEFIQTDTAINAVNSEGPFFDSKGKVVGIASSVIRASRGFLDIGMVLIIKTEKDLLAFKDPPRVGVDDLFLNREEYARFFNLDIEGELLIQNVLKISPAVKEGYIFANAMGRDILLGGDVVLELEQQHYCYVECIESAKEALSQESIIDLKYLREAKVHTAYLDITDTRQNFRINLTKKTHLFRILHKTNS